MASSIRPEEKILGYSLRERIGAGGYGEVWSAEAPGGLMKAIKFVYGYHDENRAQRELKSLNRVKELRHPFLLSLERIDVVEDQLVVISELADMSLKDRFDQCVESGLKGIPRAELLAYLRDAAGALDYIGEEHGLQHLDIKPENLLLVSGHVKVADYGLVKDVHGGTQSMLGGLTPAFAPPELFDGRPSRFSDQYSLAILYQEMLSGIRPFDGTTTAKLAAQHLKERPDLSSLPRGDQAVVSRALSKDPDMRFPSCRMLVEELTQPANRTGVSPRRIVQKKQRSVAEVVIDDDCTMHLAGGGGLMRPAEVIELPQVDVSAKPPFTRPTLIVGLGSTGTCIVHEYKRMLQRNFGPRENWPAIALLCIDSDYRDLAEATRRIHEVPLDDDETHPIRLRKPEEFRADDQVDLSWLSRRWIYNVPKSCQTEGIRPLGRLALIDNYEPTAIRLRKILSQITQAEDLGRTALSLGLDPQEYPQAYIVGSISGGICSGSALDLAAAIRGVSQQLSEAVSITGVFTYSSLRSAFEDGLGVANAISFLSELYHFNCVEGYPGASCGIPALENDEALFDHSYLCQLGRDLTQYQFEVATRDIASYLFVNTTSKASGFFNACREDAEVKDSLHLRSFNVASLGGGRAVLCETTGRLRNRLLDLWGGNIGVSHFDVTEFMADRETFQDVHKSKILETVKAGFAALDESPTVHLSEKLKRTLVESESNDVASFVVPVTEKYFQTQREVFRTWAAHFQEKIREPVSSTILELIDRPCCRFPCASLVLKALRADVAKQKSENQQLRMKFDGELTSSLKAKLPKLSSEEVARPFAEQLSTLAFKMSSCDAIDELLTAIEAVCDEIDHELSTFASRMELLREKLYVSVEDPIVLDSEAVDEQVGDCLRKHLINNRLPKLLDRIEAHLQHNLLEEVGGLQALIHHEEAALLISEPLEDAARTTIVDELRESNLEEIWGSQDSSVDVLTQWLVEKSRPPILQNGGGVRSVLLVPQHCKQPTVVAQVQNERVVPAAVIEATTGDLLMCTEVEDIPAENVLMSMLKNKPDSLEYASRLHSRNDVQWSGLSKIQ